MSTTLGTTLKLQLNCLFNNEENNYLQQYFFCFQKLLWIIIFVFEALLLIKPDQCSVTIKETPYFF